MSCNTSSIINFCSNCDNILKIVRLKDEDKIANVCETCGNIDKNINNKPIVVISTVYEKTANSFEQIINEFTTSDPTLPRIFDQKCPNDNCPSNTTKSKYEYPEIIYLRYDTVNFKFAYICKECNYCWTNDNNN